ncbi:MAG: thiamine phosphate synthase [Magnetococcus sp. YQC-9]
MPPPPKLLLITPTPLPPDLTHSVTHALTGGPFDLLLRDKSTPDEPMRFIVRELLPVLHRVGGRLLVHERVELADKTGADGVHLSEDGPGTIQVRRQLKSGSLIGRSCHSVESARKHLLASGDYVTLSPVFVTMSHPEALPLGLERFASMRASIPGAVLALGGINTENARSVLETNASGIALIRGVFNASDPAETIGKLLSIIRQGN